MEVYDQEIARQDNELVTVIESYINIEMEFGI